MVAVKALLQAIEHKAMTPPPRVAAFCESTDAYADPASTEAEFLAALAECAAWHVERLPWYAEVYRRHGTDPARWTSVAAAAADLPPIHANFFKAHSVCSVPESSVVLRLTSSGTTGQKSQMAFDAFTIGNARRMVDDVMARRGLPSDSPANYIVNGYEPVEGMKVGTSNTNAFLTKYAPPAEVFWTLRHVGGGAHEFDAFGAVAAIRRFVDSGLPLRIVGFPAFLHFLLERLRDTGCPPLQAAQGSWVVLGGGWKGHADKAVTRAELAAAVHERLGIPPQNMVETFGAVEHSVPYASCEHGRLHVPTWSRVVIRDPATLRPTDGREPGFLSFLSPYILSAPAHCVVMGDMARLHADEPCPCGRPTPWFEVLGRAGVSKNRSCAVAAAELLKPRRA